MQLPTEFSEVALTSAEKEWLERTCPYLTPDFLSYLSAYRFKPEQVNVTFVPTTGELGDISIEISGPWTETILWEVPLMACLSETYFQIVMTDWDYTGQEGEFRNGNKGAVLNAFQNLHFRKRRYFLKQAAFLASSAHVADDLTLHKTSSCRVPYELQGRPPQWGI